MWFKVSKVITSSLEGDEFQSTDTYNNSICTYNNSEDEEVMKMSKRTRTSLNMHKLLQDKGKVEYKPYENECDGDDEFPLELRSIYKENSDRKLYCA